MIKRRKIKQKKILTAIVGSYPKPVSLLPGFDARELINDSGRKFYDLLKRIGQEEFNRLLDKACEEAISDQNEAGIDIITDGEERRDHYILYHLRALEGVDFDNWQEILVREGVYKRMAPKVVGKINFKKSWLVKDFKFIQARTKKMVKMTIPGPVTATDVVADLYYQGNREKMAFDYANTVHQEVRNLIQAGCQIIQFDDPVLLRNPQRMRDWGLKALESCFAGLEDQATFVVHICRGYPNKPLEEKGINYKANADYYEQVLSFFSNSKLDQISIEGAQSNLNLSILSSVGEKTVILGVLDVGSEEVETADQLINRGKEALKYIKPSQLILAPDCGLLMISKGSAFAKLKNMADAAKILNG